jgi:hypothetical protein
MNQKYVPHNNNLLFSQDGSQFIDCRAVKQWQVLESDFPEGEAAPVWFVAASERLNARTANPVIMAEYSTREQALDALRNLCYFLANGDAYQFKWPEDAGIFADRAGKGVLRAT